MVGGVFTPTLRTNAVTPTAARRVEKLARDVLCIPLRSARGCYRIRVLWLCFDGMGKAGRYMEARVLMMADV